VGSDSKNGVRHQRALSPRLSMMMMMSCIKSVVSARWQNILDGGLQSLIAIVAYGSIISTRAH